MRQSSVDRLTPLSGRNDLSETAGTSRLPESSTRQCVAPQLDWRTVRVRPAAVRGGIDAVCGIPPGNVTTVHVGTTYLIDLTINYTSSPDYCQQPYWCSKQAGDGLLRDLNFLRYSRTARVSSEFKRLVMG